MKRCPGCGFDAALDFAFCPKCGSKLPTLCPACRSPCPADFAFCPKCGARLETAAAAMEPVAALPTAGDSPASVPPLPLTVDDPEQERRPVTVLFADISGFTALSERLDAEDVAALVDRCLRAMADVVYQYEGTVDKYIGDCLMALFGAPVAHEDDPERAIRCALTMRDRIAGIDAALGTNFRLARASNEPVLSLHTGLSTGVVVAGAVGSDRQRAYTVLGDTVNVAERLEATAASGAVVVGPVTYRLTRHAFVFEPLAALTLKGKAEPLPAYRVVGPLAAPRSARGLEAHGIAAPLVGRDSELAQLLTAFEHMLTGQTQVVRLLGEPGAGKSRLLREFLQQLETTGKLAAAHATVWRASCTALERQPYGILASLVRGALGIATDASSHAVRHKLASDLAAHGAVPEEGERMVPLLDHLLGIDDDSPLDQLEPEQRKRQLFLAARQFFERQLAQGPVVLVVEDLHWADAASLELLRFLVDRLAAQSLLVLLLQRPLGDTPALTGAEGTVVIRLKPLSAAESETLLATFFGSSFGRLPARLRDLIVTRTGGNPYYLEEVVRSLIEAGVLQRGPDGWTCSGESTLDVPATVQGVLLARLDRLPKGARRLAQEAAVLGTTFDVQLLGAIGTEPELVHLGLAQLQESELVEEAPPTTGGTGDGRYRFRHALLQEVAYQSLLRRRRTALHGRAADALEQRYGDEPERLEELEALGYHFSLSADKRRGAHYLTAAGDSARAVYANADAARYYERALAALHATETTAASREAVAVGEHLADALTPIGRHVEALTFYQSALDTYGKERDAPAQARLQRKIGLLYWDGGDREGALAHCRAGLALLDGNGEHIELAHLYQEMGRLAFRTGDNGQAVQWAEQAVQLAERLVINADHAVHLDAFGVIAHAYNTVGVAMARTGRLEEAVPHVERSVAVAQEHGLLQVACRAYTNLGVLYTTLDPAHAIETCLAGLELAKKIGHLGFQSWLYANLAGAYCTFTGQCEAEGVAAAQAAIDLDRQLGQLDHLAVPLIVLGQIYQCHGEPALAFPCYQEALTLAQTMGEPQLLFPCYEGLATLCLELGEEEQADQYLLHGQQVCEQAGVEMDTLVLLPFLC